MTTTITPEQRLTVIKHLAGGKDLDITATLTRLDRSTVLDIGNHHGYPDTDKLSWAVDVLTKNLEADAAPKQHPNAVAIASTAERVGRVLTTGNPEALARPDEIRALINASKDHSSKRIQAAGEKVLTAVDHLRDLIRDDQAKNAAKRRQEAERAAARAEVERLEAQLRAAKEKLKSRQERPGGQAAARTGQLGKARAGALVTTEQLDELGVTSKQVRTWALEHHVDCSPTGRLPTRVLDAYKDAHPTKAAS